MVVKASMFLKVDPGDRDEIKTERNAKPQRDSQHRNRKCGPLRPPPDPKRRFTIGDHLHEHREKRDDEKGET